MSIAKGHIPGTQIPMAIMTIGTAISGETAWGDTAVPMVENRIVP